MSAAALPIPYCGLPPSPDALWSRWNLDPVLIGALVLVTMAYALGAARASHKGSSLPRWRQASFYAGWAITAFAVISPLCPLSVSLFAARVGQHMILALIGAPLVAAGRPFAAIAHVSRRAGGIDHAAKNAAPVGSALLFAGLLWFWHAPAPYGETFRSTFVYWSMHLTLYGAALWLWTSLIDAPASKAFHVIFAGIVTSAQMGLLGALITLSSRALYAPHLLTTGAWGLTPLQDEQLGGAIMWAPGCAIFLAVSMLILWRILGSDILEAGRAEMVSR